MRVLVFMRPKKVENIQKSSKLRLKKYQEQKKYTCNKKNTFSIFSVTLSMS